MRTVLLAGAWLAFTVAGAVGQSSPQAPTPVTPVDLDVASFKRNTTGDSSSSMRLTANGTETLTNLSVRTIIGRAYPSRGSNQVLGLPAWAESERYDVVVKADRRGSRDEQAAMWRALLADRMKLTAHYEPREEETFDLVFARPDRRLGPNIKVSTCVPAQPSAAGTPPRQPAGPATPTEAAVRCSGFVTSGNTLRVPRTTIAGLTILLRGGAGRQVIDKTGLTENYDVEFTYAQPRPPSADPLPADPGDPPDFFTALQDQLGLRVEPSKTQVEVLVIDHIERPAEN